MSWSAAETERPWRWRTSWVPANSHGYDASTADNNNTSLHQQATALKIKVVHTRLWSVGFWSWSRFLAGNVSHRLPVDCHYFLPGLQLLSQPLRGLLPISLLGLETLLNAYKTMSHAEGVYWIACHMHLSDQTSAKFQLIVSNCDKVMLY